MHIQRPHGAQFTTPFHHHGCNPGQQEKFNSLTQRRLLDLDTHALDLFCLWILHWAIFVRPRIFFSTQQRLNQVRLLDYPSLPLATQPLSPRNYEIHHGPMHPLFCFLPDQVRGNQRRRVILLAKPHHSMVNIHKHAHGAR